MKLELIKIKEIYGVVMYKYKFYFNIISIFDMTLYEGRSKSNSTHFVLVNIC